MQLSSQHLRDFQSRSKRYRRSDVDCCWILLERPVAERLTKAIAYEHMDYYRIHGVFQGDLEELLLFGVSLENKNQYPDQSPMLCFGRGHNLQRLSLGDDRGVITGLPGWNRPHWSCGK